MKKGQLIIKSILILLSFNILYVILLTASYKLLLKNDGKNTMVQRAGDQSCSLHIVRIIVPM